MGKVRSENRINLPASYYINVAPTEKTNFCCCLYGRMSKKDEKHFYIILSLLFLTLLFCGCTEPNSPTDGAWISLGPQGKQVVKIKTSPSYIYACAGRDGLYRLSKSSLTGSWEYIGLTDTTLINGIFTDTLKGVRGPNTNGVADVVINPNNENEILAGILTLKPNIPGIYKTTNGGKNWFEADSGYGFIPYWLPDDSGNYSPWTSAWVLFNPANQFDVIFAGDASNDGIYKSTNSGLTWQAVIKPAVNDHSQVNTFSQDPINPNIIYAGGSSSPSDVTLLRPAWFMKSSDNGDTWQTILPALPDNIYFDSDVIDICITANPQAIYLGMRGFVLGSKDEGKTWTKLITDTDYIGNTFSVESSPKNEKHIVAADGQIFLESPDAGNTWTKLKAPANGSVRKLNWDKSTDNLYCISIDDGGVYVLPNASSLQLGEIH